MEEAMGDEENTEGERGVRERRVVVSTVSQCQRQCRHRCGVNLRYRNAIIPGNGAHHSAIRIVRCGGVRFSPPSPRIHVISQDRQWSSMLEHTSRRPSRSTSPMPSSAWMRRELSKREGKEMGRILSRLVV